MSDTAPPMPPFPTPPGPSPTPAPVPADKPAWQSKTLWVALLMALAGFYPPVQAWVQTNPEIFTTILTMVFAALRFISKGKVVIS